MCVARVVDEGGERGQGGWDERTSSEEKVWEGMECRGHYGDGRLERVTNGEKIGDRV